MPLLLERFKSKEEPEEGGVQRSVLEWQSESDNSGPLGESANAQARHLSRQLRRQR